MDAVSGTAVSTGDAFTSVTESVIAASELSIPSVARTLNGYVPGPWASVGVQLNTPVVESSAAPAGAPTSESLKVCAGRSGSVTLAVNVYGASSGIVADAGTPEMVGAVFAGRMTKLAALMELATLPFASCAVTRT